MGDALSTARLGMALLLALATAGLTPARAVGPEDLPQRPAPTTSPAQPAPGNEGWRAEYTAAVRLIKGGDPEAGLARLTALRTGEPEARDHADVLNFVAFAHRKMKRYPEAKTFYELALAKEPDHLGALEYYGEWHLETGDRAGAERFLKRLAALCGGLCEEYRDLKEALEKAPR